VFVGLTIFLATRRRWGAFAVLISVFVLALLVDITFCQSRGVRAFAGALRLKKTPSLMKDPTTGRIFIWKSSIEAALKSPVTGVGLRAVARLPV